MTTAISRSGNVGHYRANTSSRNPYSCIGYPRELATACRHGHSLFDGQPGAGLEFDRGVRPWFELLEYGDVGVCGQRV